MGDFILKNKPEHKTENFSPISYHHEELIVENLTEQPPGSQLSFIEICLPLTLPSITVFTSHYAPRTTDSFNYCYILTNT